ncbi:MAG: hypothetical protein LBH45_05485 [Campylobacteraceae bacterium]|nr:hypothetical protein [Campylobacteraceae bacterium]
MSNGIYKRKVVFSTLLYKCTFIFIVLFSFVDNVAAKAIIENLNDARLNFDCNSLYYVQDSSNVFKVYGLKPGIQTTLTSKKQYNLNVQSEYQGASGRNPDTIALGTDQSGALVMYQWDYVKYSNQIERIYKNQVSSIASSFSFKEFRDFRGWAGGEVNQKTGEIYFIGYNQDRLDGDARMMIYDPSTQKVSKSGVLQPESPSDARFASYKVQSDMAIDADGNAYIMISEDKNFHLLKVTPDKNNQNNWRYTEVQKFTLDTKAEIWGMSFLNGMLYINSRFYIYELNPLTGTWRDTKFYADNSYDFTACQMAPVIKGKVYLDADGDGILSSSEKKSNGLKDIEIQVYDIAYNHLGSQLTNSKGEYNFLLPSSNSTFYIRMKKPQMNGLNVGQTWASGGKYTWNGPNNRGVNSVTPICHNNMSIPNTKYYEKACYGAKENGIEHSSNFIALANFYSVVNMETDRAVVHADFALAPLDRSDAPGSFGEAFHVINKNLYLGLNASVDSFSKSNPNANGDNYDDGVEVRLENNTTWSNLQNFTFVSNKKYNFRVKVNSNGATKGFLNAWIALQSATFSSKIADNLQDINNSGYIEFNYTMPEFIIKNADNKTKTFFRFRYNTKNITNILPYNPPKSYLNNYPWTIDGEVEDYMSVYHYVVAQKRASGSFLVVNQNFNAKAGASLDVNSHGQTALYTQIADKKFNVKLVYHERGKVSKDLGGDMNVTIDFVEYNTPLPNCNNVKILKKNINTFTLKPAQTIMPFEVTLHNVTDSGTFKVNYHLLGSSETNSTCSDIFVVRPQEFVLNNAFGKDLIGGKFNDGQIKALKNGGALAKDYNQQAINIIHVNSTLKKPSACKLDINASGEVMTKSSDINKGIGNISINYHNIGDIDIILSDKLFASKDKVHKDCLDELTNNHSADGKVGCDIAVTSKLRFIPKAFNGTYKISDFGQNNTYISSELAMHANIDMSISAILDDNSTAINYHKDCFAEDREYNVQFANDNVTGWDNRKGDKPSKRIMYIKKTGADIISNNTKNDGLAILKTTQDNFINGTAYSNLGFNFVRPSKPEKPFIVKSDDFNITFPNSINSIKSFDSFNGNGSVHMYYGRVHSEKSEYIVLNQNNMNASIRYEIYCPVYCDRNLYDIVKFSNKNDQYPDWYINSAHAINQGNATEFKIIQGSASLTKSTYDTTPKYYTDAINSGKETLGITKNSPNTPYSVTIDIKSDSWLVHDPAFKVIFAGKGSDWAGFGQVNKTDNVGRTLNVNASRHLREKINW